MAIEGSLQDVGLADICQLLSMGRKTGCLSMTDRSNFGYIYFEDGRVIFASVLNRPDRLGELLVMNGVITRAQLAEALEAEAHNRGQRLGEILIRQGALTDEQLRKYISVQIEEAVYNLFAWTHGSFHFDPGQRPEGDELFLVDIPAENLLLEGARRVDEWSQIEKKIPSLDLVFHVVRTPAEEDTVEFTPAQHKILALLDGKRSVDEVVAGSGLVEFDAGKALYGLIQAGFVDRSGRTVSAPGPEEPSDGGLAQHLTLGVAFVRCGMIEDATREFQAALALDRTSAEALFRLGLIAFQAGRLSEALEFYDRMRVEGAAAYAVARNRAVVLELLGRYDEASAVLDAAEQKRPGDPEIALARAVVLLKVGSVGAAIDALRLYRASQDGRKPSAVYYAYAVLAQAMLGDLDAAIGVGREGLSHHAESGPVLVNLGVVLELRGEMDAAAALFTRALAAAPVPPQAHKSLGDQAFSRGDMESARIHYEKAVKINPRLGDDVYMRLGTLAHRDGDIDVARLLWRRALELNPSNEAVEAHLEMLESGA